MKAMNDLMMTQIQINIHPWVGGRNGVKAVAFRDVYREQMGTLAWTHAAKGVDRYFRGMRAMASALQVAVYE